MHSIVQPELAACQQSLWDWQCDYSLPNSPSKIGDRGGNHESAHTVKSTGTGDYHVLYNPTLACLWHTVSMFDRARVQSHTHARVNCSTHSLGVPKFSILDHGCSCCQYCHLCTPSRQQAGSTLQHAGASPLLRPLIAARHTQKTCLQSDSGSSCAARARAGCCASRAAHTRARSALEPLMRLAPPPNRCAHIAEDMQDCEERFALQAAAARSACTGTKATSLREIDPDQLWVLQQDFIASEGAFNICNNAFVVRLPGTDELLVRRSVACRPGHMHW